MLHKDVKNISIDCDAMAGTLDTHELKPYFNQQSDFTSYPVTIINLPCSCSNCRSHNENEPPYLNTRNRKQYTMKIKNIHVNED